jgi:hypothetical protein
VTKHIVTLHVEGDQSEDDWEAVENDLYDLDVKAENYPRIKVTYVDVVEERP